MLRPRAERGDGHFGLPPSREENHLFGRLLGRLLGHLFGHLSRRLSGRLLDVSTAQTSNPVSSRDLPHI